VAFIRKRLSSNDPYRGTQYCYQVIQTYREGGKVRQRVLACIYNPTIEEEIEHLREAIKQRRVRDVAKSEARLARLEEIAPLVSKVTRPRAPWRNRWDRRLEAEM
jgi:hypothetical protein